MHRQKLLSIVLTAACLLTAAGCENINIPGKYSVTVTEESAEAQAAETLPAQETLAPPEDAPKEELPAPPQTPEETPAPQAQAPQQTPPVPQTPPAPQQTPPAPQQTPPAAQQSKTEIGEAKAREIALSHAGLTEQDVTFIKSHPDYEDGRYVYEVEFYKGTTEYDYDIDAYTGAILSFDYDVEDYEVKAPKPKPAPQQPQQASGTQITLDQAKAIALQKAGVTAGSAVFTKAKLDMDDGIPEYEIEFIVGEWEYEVEVDARNGAIRDFDMDSIYDD